MAESNKMKGSQEHIYRCNEGDFFKFLVCRNQCCLSGNLSGTGWRYGITGYFTFETACNHLPFGGNFSIFVRNAQKPGLIKDPYIYKPDSIMLDMEDAVAEIRKMQHVFHSIMHLRRLIIVFVNE